MAMVHRATWRSVRQDSSEALHAIANKLRRDGMQEDLTEGQERLWDQVVGELEWRSARARRRYRRCWCDLCVLVEEISQEHVTAGCDVDALEVPF